MECVVQCAFCKKSFSDKKSFYVHCRKFHDMEPLPLKYFECKFCSAKFSSIKTLNIHIKECTPVNSGQNITNELRIICPYGTCNEEFITFVRQRKHLSDIHDINVEYEKLNFCDITEFEAWKHEVEQQTFSMYISNRAASKLSNGNMSQLYYCHCSFNYQKQGDDIREMKFSPTNKICPAMMKVIISKFSVCTEFWKTHCGHAEDIRLIQLTKKIKTQIADSNCQTEISSDTLVQQDLYSIIHDININCGTKSEQNDLASVKLWVTEMENHGKHCPVLYYKNQNDVVSNVDNEGFVLILMTNFQAQQIVKFGPKNICIDSTYYERNTYNIQLYTIMTMNEFGLGCPVAFCFSNRSDECLLKLFFRVIKSEVGQIQSKVFMSDDTLAFYNAWISVMGPVTHKLLCKWYIDRTWRDDLNKINGGFEKKTLVYKTLNGLLQLRSIEEFKIHHVQVIQNLLNDNDTKEFGIHFKKHYSNRPECWAFCYRLQLGNILCFESYHTELLHIYLKGEKMKLDQTINAVLKLTQDSLHRRLIMLSINIPLEKIKNVHQNHEASKNIKLEHIKILNNNMGYIITSLSNISLQHHIIKVGHICNHQSCLKCKECNICFHTFQCTCVDNLIKMNICKHIHACAREVSKSFYNNNVHVENITKQKYILRQTSVQNNATSNNNDHIASQAKLNLGSITTYSYNDQQKELIKEQLDDGIKINSQSVQNAFKFFSCPTVKDSDSDSLNSKQRIITLLNHCSSSVTKS